ncbi:MAG: hypothetical protein A3H98_07965 [Bacteroidetes bacterium RIFCSPLOWO2_02_FULL_36_8]|nr:MAG: hypothetical protein A3H98_07965 [Bacteroidetes bacterium RIFCSPLOWO2_02_FULL_36_8]OFY68967.1 MAG: hypothetical protein A3G23_10425 [Bacteroidetes bacterium RIFCSPLOWO2_12_FULL_37_12]
MNTKATSILKIMLGISCVILSVSILIFSISSLTHVQADSKSFPAYQQGSGTEGDYMFQTFSHGGYINVLIWKSSTGRSRFFFFDAKGKSWKSWLENEQLNQAPLK